MFGPAGDWLIVLACFVGAFGGLRALAFWAEGGRSRTGQVLFAASALLLAVMLTLGGSARGPEAVPAAFVSVAAAILG